MKHNKIIAIAIDDYDDAELTNLNNCKKDVEKIIEVLNDRYEFNDIEFIFSKEETTRSYLYNRLKEYFGNCLNDDNVLLIFAGHGEYDGKLKIPYWQTSDSDHKDASTWFDISQLLKFIKSSEAFHVAVISDSCFSGGILEPPTRGGGIGAFKNKRSRWALTSGSIEKVKDGKPGEHSPFAKVILSQLLQNEQPNMLFQEFASSVVREFPETKKQTPRMGIIEDTEHEGGAFIFKLKPQHEQEDKASIDNIVIEINESLPYLDQLSEFVDQLYHDLNFIPTHLLTSAEPIFKKKNGWGDYYSNFTLNTSNDELYDLFACLKIANGKLTFKNEKYTLDVEESEKKIQKIVNHLADNLFYSISRNRESIDIRQFKNNLTCDCIKCRAEKWEFSSIKNELNKFPEDISDLMLVAFTNYSLGNFEMASRQFLLAKEKSLKDKRHILTFIINYNLSKLHNLLYKRAYLGKISQDIYIELDKVNMDDAFCSYGLDNFRPVADWLYRERYLHSAQEKIGEYITSIRKQYNSSELGGTSQNNFVNGLISEFAKVDLFLRRNFIAFQNFKEYVDLSNQLAEGLIASFSIKTPGNSKLETFNLGLLNAIYRYCNPEQLMILMNQYKVDELKLENPKKANLLQDEFNKLIGEYKSRKDLVGKIFEKENDFYFNNQNKLIHSAIVLSAKTNFTKKDTNRFVKTLIKFLEEFGTYNDIKYTEYLFYQKSSSIEKSQFKSLILAAINNSRLHSQFFFESITNACFTEKIKLNFTTDEFNRILNLCDQKCEQCGQSHSMVFYVYIYRVLTKQSQKSVLENRIRESLEAKFDFNLFSFSIIFEILDLDDNLVQLAIEHCTPKNKPLPENDDFNNLDDLNLLFNVCFKEELTFDSSRFDPIKGINNYYDWLIQMDRFNYEQFNPVWVYAYSTIFYYKRMAQSTPLKAHLENILKQKPFSTNQKLMNTYMNIYVKKTWDIQ